MSRSDDLKKLSSESFDVLILGGGIYGSWIACYCARSGLKTAIVEMNDWGSGTSSVSSKLLHGGLRYLERFEIGMVRKSLIERRELAQRMPHHVRPLNFLLPLYRHSRFRRWQLKPGLWLYDLLAGRNQPVERHRSLSTRDFHTAEPALAANDLVGGFQYGDCGTDDARMVLEVIDSAADFGAVAVAGVRAKQLTRSGDRISGAIVEDGDSGSDIPVTARIVINTTGPWVFGREELKNHLPAIRHTKGVHLVMPGTLSHHAVLLTARSDGRVFFLIPWYGRTLLGTTDTDHHAATDAATVTSDDVDYLLDAANDYLETPWSRDDVQGTYVGLRTMVDESGATASSVSREWLFDETEPGLMTSIGGKYTSARIDGVHATEQILDSLGRSSAIDTDAPLAWFPGDNFDAWQKQMVAQAMAVGFDEQTATTSSRRFGRRFTDVIEIGRQDSSMTRRIVADLPFSFAEVVHAARNERVRTLTDLLRRRIPLLLLTPIDRETVTECCSLVAAEFQWSDERQAAEIAAVLELAAKSRAALTSGRLRHTG